MVNIKMARVGGLTASREIQALCAEHGIPCWVGGMLESARRRRHLRRAGDPAQLHLSGRHLPVVVLLTGTISASPRSSSAARARSPSLRCPGSRRRPIHAPRAVDGGARVLPRLTRSCMIRGLWIPTIDSAPVAPRPLLCGCALSSISRSRGAAMRDRRRGGHAAAGRAAAATSRAAAPAGSAGLFAAAAAGQPHPRAPSTFTPTPRPTSSAARWTTTKLAQLAATRRMEALVFKNHVTATADPRLAGAQARPRHQGVRWRRAERGGGRHQRQGGGVGVAMQGGHGRVVWFPPSTPTTTCAAAALRALGHPAWSTSGARCCPRCAGPRGLRDPAAGGAYRAMRPRRAAAPHRRRPRSRLRPHRGDPRPVRRGRHDRRPHEASGGARGARWTLRPGHAHRPRLPLEFMRHSAASSRRPPRPASAPWARGTSCWGPISGRPAIPRRWTGCECSWARSWRTESPRPDQTMGREVPGSLPDGLTGYRGRPSMSSQHRGVHWFSSCVEVEPGRERTLAVTPPGHSRDRHQTDGAHLRVCRAPVGPARSPSIPGGPRSMRATSRPEGVELGRARRAHPPKSRPRGRRAPAASAGCAARRHCPPPRARAAATLHAGTAARAPRRRRLMAGFSSAALP